MQQVPPMRFEERMQAMNARLAQRFGNVIAGGSPPCAPDDAASHDDDDSDWEAGADDRRRRVAVAVAEPATSLLADELVRTCVPKRRGPKRPPNFVAEVARMMHGFGDVPSPDPAAVDIIEKDGACCRDRNWCLCCCLRLWLWWRCCCFCF
jgi:hypothetical protein